MQVGFRLQPGAAYLKRLRGGSGTYRSQGRLPACLLWPYAVLLQEALWTREGGGLHVHCPCRASRYLPKAPIGRDSLFLANGSCRGRWLEARAVHGALCPPPSPTPGAAEPQGAIPRAGSKALRGRIRPMGRSLATPALDCKLFGAGAIIHYMF